MILIGTHSKIAKANGSIYRVDFAEFTHRDLTIPASREHFATAKAAEYASKRYGDLLTGNITPVPASDFNPWTDR